MARQGYNSPRPGTISKKILKDFPFHHLSTGDALRAHVQEGTSVGAEAKSFMDSGAPGRGVMPPSWFLQATLLFSTIWSIPNAKERPARK
jgi:hypothetical protein